MQRHESVAIIISAIAAAGVGGTALVAMLLLVMDSVQDVGVDLTLTAGVPVGVGVGLKAAKKK